MLSTRVCYAWEAGRPAVRTRVPHRHLPVLRDRAVVEVERPRPSFPVAEVVAADLQLRVVVVVVVAPHHRDQVEEVAVEVHHRVPCGS